MDHLQSPFWYCSVSPKVGGRCIGIRILAIRAHVYESLGMFRPPLGMRAWLAAIIRKPNYGRKQTSFEYLRSVYCILLCYSTALFASKKVSGDLALPTDTHSAICVVPAPGRVFMAFDAPWW
jgi:hypothetical protein